jgi:hypothetical protein
MQHSVVLASKAGSIYVWEANTAPWTFRPFNWCFYVHSLPRGQDVLSGYHAGTGEPFDAMQTRLGFGWKRSGVSCLLKVPYWFIVLVSGGLVLIWGRHRRSQFSVRALLITTMMIAIAVEVAVSSARGSGSTALD